MREHERTLVAEHDPARHPASSQRRVWSVLILLSVAQFMVIWTAPGILEALIPGRMQSHACTAEVPR